MKNSLFNIKLQIPQFMKLLLIPIFVLLVVFCSNNTVKAQQEPVNTQYLFNPIPINPAYTGSTDFFNITLQSRHQWVGFEGAPSTQMLTLNKPMPYFNSGIGLTVLSDRIGPVKCTGFTASYAYHLKLTEKIKLGLGVNLGFKHYIVKLSDINEDNDRLFSSDQTTKMLPGIGCGLFCYSDDFYAGVSTPELVKNTDVFDSHSSMKMIPNQERHYYVMAGYIYSFEDYNLKLKPTVLAKMINSAPASFDIGVQAVYKDKFWFGANYRPGDSFSPIVQMQLFNKLRFGYSFDFTTSELQEYNKGTHEIALFYVFSKEPSRIKSPRFF